MRVSQQGGMHQNQEDQVQPMPYLTHIVESVKGQLCFPFWLFRLVNRFIYREQYLEWYDLIFEFLRGYKVPKFSTFSGDDEKPIMKTMEYQQFVHKSLKFWHAIIYLKGKHHHGPYLYQIFRGQYMLLKFTIVNEKSLSNFLVSEASDWWAWLAFSFKSATLDDCRILGQ